MNFLSCWNFIWYPFFDPYIRNICFIYHCLRNCIYQSLTYEEKLRRLSNSSWWYQPIILECTFQTASFARCVHFITFPMTTCWRLALLADAIVAERFSTLDMLIPCLKWKPEENKCPTFPQKMYGYNHQLRFILPLCYAMKTMLFLTAI